MKSADIRKALEIASLGQTALDVLSKITRTGSDDKAAAILAGVVDVISTYFDSRAGIMSTDDAEALIVGLGAKLSSNKNDAITAEHEKFGGG